MVAKNTYEFDLGDSFQHNNLYASEKGWGCGAKRGTYDNTSEERRRFVLKVVKNGEFEMDTLHGLNIYFNETGWMAAASRGAYSNKEDERRRF